MNLVKRFAVLAAFISLALADMDMDEGEKVEFHPVNASSKTFHWILTLTILFMLPCVSSVLAFAEKFNFASLLHVVSLCYSATESLFIDFPDNVDNHENKTSKGLTNTKKKEDYMASRLISRVYKTLLFLVALTGWVRVCLAPVALFGFCYGKATGQCIAHGIMGSSFILYGFVLAWVLVIPWIRNERISRGAIPRKSQEFWDSSLMCLWGIVNTFTEHRWGREPWSHGDYQHTSMGIIWWCGGLLGMWLSRKNGTRNVIPALLLIYTGYAMSQHSQHLAISTKVHAMFGLTFMIGGLSRIIEICFLLSDASSSKLGKVLSFQHFPPLCLVMSGILFMSANEEQLVLVYDLGADHSSYILVVCGAGFMIYLWILLLLSFFLYLVGYDENGELGSADGYANIEGGDGVDFELDNLSDMELNEGSSR